MTRRGARPWRNTTLQEARACFDDPMDADEVRQLLVSGHATKRELRLCGTIKTLTEAVNEMVTTNQQLANELNAAYQKIAQYGSEFTELSQAVEKMGDKEVASDAQPALDPK